MSDVVIVALITGVPTVLTVIGAGLAWLVRFIQAQSKATVEAKDAEIDALKARIALMEEQKEGGT